MVGFDRSDILIEGFRANGMEVSREFFAFRSDAHFTHTAMAAAGFGFAILHLDVAASHPNLRRVLADQVGPELPIWLTAHAELKTSARVRRVFDFLAARLSELYGD